MNKFVLQAKLIARQGVDLITLKRQDFSGQLLGDFFGAVSGSDAYTAAEQHKYIKRP